MKAMKYLKIGMVCCALLTFLPFGLRAQDAESPVEAAVESSLSDSLELVQLAYRKVNLADVPSDVSVVDVQKLLETNYFTNSLDGMAALASGFNGNIWG